MGFAKKIRSNYRGNYCNPDITEVQYFITSAILFLLVKMWAGATMSLLLLLLPPTKADASWTSLLDGLQHFAGETSNGWAAETAGSLSVGSETETQRNGGEEEERDWTRHKSILEQMHMYCTVQLVHIVHVYTALFPNFKEMVIVFYGQCLFSV